MFRILPAILLVLMAGCGSLTEEERYADYRRNVERVASDRVAAISRSVTDDIAAARAISGLPGLTAALGSWSDPGNHRARLQATELFTAMAQIHPYGHVWALDASGGHVLSVTPQVVMPLEARSALGTVLADTVAAARLYLKSDTVRILFAAPIRSPDRGRLVGWVVLEALADSSLGPLARIHPGRRPTVLMIAQRADSQIFMVGRGEGARFVALREGAVPGFGPFQGTGGLPDRDTSGLFGGKAAGGLIAAVRRLRAAPWRVAVATIRAQADAAIGEDRRWAVLATGATALGSLMLLTGVWHFGRVRNRRRLTAAEGRLAFLTGHSNDAIFCVRSDLRILDANQRASEVYGYSHDEFLAATIDMLSLPDDRSASVTRAADLARTGGGVFKTRHRRRDGTDLAVEVSTKMVEIDGDRMFCSIVRDVTERLDNEARIAELSAAQLSTADQIRLLSEAVNQNPVAIVITDRGGDIVYANAAFTTMTGYPVEEVLGCNPRILRSGAQDGDFYVDLWRTISAGRVWKGEMRNRRKDGSDFWESAVISPVTDTAGTITHYIGLKEDITARRELERRYLHAQRMEAVGQIAGGVAHDFNNLLTVILGHAEMVEGTLGLSEQGRADIGQVIQAASRAADLTRQLLAFSKKQVMQPRVIPLGEAVAGVDRMIRRVIGEDIRLSTILAPGTGSVRVDPGQLEQVILNLVVNAKDAMPGGGALVLETSAAVIEPGRGLADGLGVELPPGRYAKLTVKDTGIGMDTATRARVFEPFFTTKKEMGTGLGLSTVYGIVSQSGGAVWCESAPNAGTTFTVLLPETEAEPDTGDAGTPPNSAAAHGEETVLVVEDDPAVRQLIEATLIHRGFAVLVAESAESALGLLHAHPGPIDLILSDVVLPARSGPAFLAEARVQRPEARLLLMSGYAGGAINAHGGLTEGAAFLAKPFLPGALANKIREVLDRDQRPPARAAGLQSARRWPIP